MKHTKRAGKMILMGFAVLVTAALGITAWDLWVANSYLQVMTRVREANRPHTTILGSSAATRWLWPQRPHSPWDPFEECGIPSVGDSRWDFLVRLVAARERLACLQEQIAKAHEKHHYFEDILFCLCSTAFVLIEIFTLWGSAESPDQALEDEEHEEERPQLQNSEEQRSAWIEEAPSSSFEITEVPVDRALNLKPLATYQSDAADSTTWVRMRWPSSVVPLWWNIFRSQPRDQQHREVVHMQYNPPLLLLDVVLKVPNLLLLVYLCLR